jgi:hypothetical protein
LLLIFAFAAAVAIGIYRELPRAVFESARAKEELLVERGEQYKLAIRRFYAKNKAYPQTIEQLEETNGIRFLRQRYKDPMTGKDEWRLIHMGPAGYTDSKVFKPQNPAEQKQVYESSITAGYSVGQTQPTSAELGMQGVAMRQRAGDQLRPGTEIQEGQEQPSPDGDSDAQGQRPPPPGPDGENPGQPQEQQPNMGMIPAPANPPVPGQEPTQTPPGPGTLPPGVGANPGMPGSPQPPPPGSIGSGQGSFATAPNPGQPGANPTPAQPGNPALRQIQGILTSPRPSAANTGGGAPPGAVPTGASQATPFVGGIAGVASKYEGEGIKLIHDRSKIDEWEFLFDHNQAQQNVAAGGQQAQPGGPGQQPGPGGAPAGARPGGLGSNVFGSGGSQPGMGVGGARGRP